MPQQFVISRIWTPMIEVVDPTQPGPQPIKLYVGQENGRTDSTENFDNAWKFVNEEDAKSCLSWLTKGWAIETIEIEDPEKIEETGTEATDEKPKETTESEGAQDG